MAERRLGDTVFTLAENSSSKETCRFYWKNNAIYLANEVVICYVIKVENKEKACPIPILARSFVGNGQVFFRLSLIDIMEL